MAEFHNTLSRVTVYGTDGRISSAGFLHGRVEKQFTYAYLPGTHLLQTLTKPNNMTLTQSYEPQRDLLTGMLYKRGNTAVAQRTYTYDTLGRPLTRTTARNGQTVNDTFGYNNRSELTTATVNGGAYAYDYDNIGNRKSAQEVTEEVTGYTANNLNQYTALTVDGDIDFQPEYDADGNQCRVKTSTGIWTVSYDAENRPKDFTSQAADGTITSVHCEYDYMGRRTTKMVTVGNNVTLQQRYIYRDYLQIACIDLTRSHHPALWFITWDPTQPIATRPLAIQKDGSWFTYGWDLTKNICELYGPAGYIRTAYTYSPYGQVTSTGDVEQPIQWSSEFNDTELGLTYYNYRHYNPVDGRWLGRDKKDSATGNHIYAYVSKFPVLHGDQLGEDRYYYCYSGDIGLHGVLIIDNWKKRDANTKKNTCRIWPST
ncbi:MAG: hypothetical protein IJE88_04650 [Akkermansia sp.]|nr:hypothetical protein [Akkermansia sp.]